MSKHLNNTLPFEILKKIFQYVYYMRDGKDTIKSCLFVCKSWKVAAYEFFGEMSIKINEDSLKKLAKDIVYFGQNLKHITLQEGFPTINDRTATCLFWLDIILACPNLVSIKIDVRDDYNYVRCIMDTATEKLGQIQHFQTSTPHFRLQLNLKYRKTITSLYIRSLEDLPEKDSDDNIIHLISLFPKLTSLDINLILVFNRSDIDITQLLEAAPQLQRVKVVMFLGVIKSSSIKTTTTTTAKTDNLCLTSLTLEVREIDVNSLIFITTRLKKLNYLRLDIKDLVIDETQEDFNEAKLYHDLHSLTTDIPEVSIFYKYQGRGYSVENPERPYDGYSNFYDEVVDTSDDYDYDGADIYDDYYDGSTYYDYYDD